MIKCDQGGMKVGMEGRKATVRGAAKIGRGLQYTPFHPNWKIRGGGGLLGSGAKAEETQLTHASSKDIPRDADQEEAFWGLEPRLKKQPTHAGSKDIPRDADQEEHPTLGSWRHYRRVEAPKFGVSSSWTVFRCQFEAVVGDYMGSLGS